MAVKRNFLKKDRDERDVSKRAKMLYFWVGYSRNRSDYWKYKQYNIDDNKYDNNDHNKLN